MDELNTLLRGIKELEKALCDGATIYVDSNEGGVTLVDHQGFTMWECLSLSELIECAGEA